MRWLPTGKRRERPKETYRRSVDKEMDEKNRTCRPTGKGRERKTKIDLICG